MSNPTVPAAAEGLSGRTLDEDGRSVVSGPDAVPTIPAPKALRRRLLADALYEATHATNLLVYLDLEILPCSEPGAITVNEDAAAAMHAAVHWVMRAAQRAEEAAEEFLSEDAR